VSLSIAFHNRYDLHHNPDLLHRAKLVSAFGGIVVKILGWLWLAATLVVLSVGFHQAIFVAPVEATMGEIYRIFYWHVPINMTALVLPYVNLVASIVYLALRHRSPATALKADALALASAETTLLYTSVGIITGMLWARPVWGIWWTWDARLTSFLVLWLLYVSYMLLRSFSSAGQTQTLAAVLAVFAGVDVPIVYFSIQWWRTQHPQPVFGDGGSLDPAMTTAFLWNLAGWVMWGVYITGLRYVLERRRQQKDQTAALTAMEVSQ
jgi:heme exporter protein C